MAKSARSGDQTRDAEYVLKMASDLNVRFIRLWFTDVLGRLKSFAITIDELEGALTEGMGFDGSSIEGFARIWESDMMAHPDPSTFQLLPWRPTEKGAVARMFCDIKKTDGSPFEGDPRFVLKRNLQKAAKLGYTFYIGPELEYFYFKNPREHRDPRRGRLLRPHAARRGQRPAPRHGADARGDGHPRRVQPSRGGAQPARDRPALRRRAHHGRQRHDAQARRQGDRAAPRRVRDLHAQADLRRQRLRHARPPVALQGRPQRLLRRRRQVQALEGRQGLHRRHPHARAARSAAVTNQWVNSYKRLVPGYEAPVYVSWAKRNRSAMVRVPDYKVGKEKATRAELRCPDPACNPYLAFSVMLAAGLKGVEENYKLPEPIEEDIFEMSESAAHKARHHHAARQPHRGRHRARGLRTHARVPRRARLREVRRLQEDRVGSLPNHRHRVGTPELPVGDVSPKRSKPRSPRGGHPAAPLLSHGSRAPGPSQKGRPDGPPLEVGHSGRLYLRQSFSQQHPPFEASAKSGCSFTVLPVSADS